MSTIVALARRYQPWLLLSAGAVAPPAVALTLVLARESLSGASLAMIVALVVVSVAAVGHRVPAYVAGVCGALAFDVLLTEPYGSLTIYHRDDLVAAGGLLLLAVAVGEVAHRSRSRAVEVARRDEDIGRMYYTAELAAHGGEPSVLIDTVGRELSDLLGLQAWLWDDDPQPAETMPEVGRDGAVHIGEVVWPAGEAGLPNGTRLLVVSADRVVGGYVLEPTVGRLISPRELLVAISLADQVGAAFSGASPGPVSR